MTTKRICSAILFASMLLICGVLSGCGAGVCVFGNIGECPKTGTPVYLAGPVVLTVSDDSIGFGQTTQFTATGGKSPYTFSVTSGGGSIDTDGTYTAPSGSGSASATILVTDSRYTGTGDPDSTHFASLSITISTR